MIWVYPYRRAWTNLLGRYTCSFVPREINAIIFITLLQRFLFSINIPRPAILFTVNNCFFFTVELNFHVRQWITTKNVSFKFQWINQLINQLTLNSNPSMDFPIVHVYQIPFPNFSNYLFHFALHFCREYKFEHVWCEYVRSELH